MASKSVELQQASQQRQDRERVTSTIAKYVMLTLGQPGNLLKLDVRHLWKDNYRANVLVGTDAGSAKVAHSYFLVTDGNGKVLTSTPALAKHYPVLAGGGS